MNKSIFYENRIIKIINDLSEKYNCSMQLVDNLPANACIIKFDDKYIIFISEKLDHKLLPLTILHEMGHIHFNTIRDNPKNYNYFAELLSNLYALRHILFSFNYYTRFKLLFLSFISEKRLYKYFINKTLMEGDKIYEQINKNE